MLRTGIRLGRISGINIQVDWSWLLIMVMIVWNMLTAFGQIHTSWQPGVRWGVALLAAFMFFGSVLAHELAHSLVARSQGLPVRNITLYLFGGVSNIQSEPSSPKNEFWMAIAGPLTSLALGVIMLALVAGSLFAYRQSGAAAGQILATLSPINTVLLWLGSVNIILAIFNLIPGFPLDGGRVLRSIIWAVTNNLRTATRMAAVFGQLVAWVLIILGIAMAFGLQVPLLGSGLVSGLWMAFIGWFLYSASAQSAQQVRLQDLLDHVPVSRVMMTNPVTIEPDCSVADLVHTHMMGNQDHGFPVMENGHLVGMVALNDVRKSPQDAWNSTYVRNIMTPAGQLVTTAPEEDTAAAMEKLIEKDVRQLPVVRPGAYGGELLGLLRREDIMRWLQTHNGARKPGSP